MHDKTTGIMLIIYVFILFAVILWCLTQSELSIIINEDYEGYIMDEDDVKDKSDWLS